MDWITKFFTKSTPIEPSQSPEPSQPPAIFIIPEWRPKPNWTEETLELLKEFSIEDTPKQSLSDIIVKSKNFPIDFPTQSNKCEYLNDARNIPEDVLKRNINSVYPLIHENVLQLCCDFILFKRNHGNKRERSFYNKIGVKDLINRLISRRAVSFLGSYDGYKLLDKSTGVNQWEVIGTAKEVPPLTIEEYMTYDELKLSALLSVSSYTYFVNDGRRLNEAKYEEDRSKIESEGIIIGMVGPRIHRSNAVEYQEIIITDSQNTKANGFGSNVKNSIPKLFAEFYGEKCLGYDERVKAIETDKAGRYVNILNRYTFDNVLYYKRLTISIDTLLGEANARAKSALRFAYLHVVGIGLGVWKISCHQDELFMDIFANRITFLGEKLSHISDIYFAYINATQCGKYVHGDLIPIPNHPKGGIRIQMGKKNPHNKLVDEDEGKLLVVSYAWDGNSLPGNEYWHGSLTTSSDPAAACSTQVAEIHNPHINPVLSADNLRIVTDGDLLTVEEYKNKIFFK